MNQPKVSIVIPMFNARKYIATTIDSILAQTFEDFEVIVIDDHSTDGSSDFLRDRYSDSRIKFFQNFRNMGDTETRNIGLDLAQSEFVYFMDHDDAILPKTLEILVNAAEKSQAEVVFMNSVLIPKDQDFTYEDEVELDRILINNPTPRFLSKNLTERLQKELIDRDCLWEPWIKIHRRDFLIENKIFFPPIFATSDLLLHLATLLAGKKLQIIDASCYVHRKTPTSISRSNRDEYLRRALETLPNIIEYLENLFTKKNLPKISRENQLIIESYLVTSLTTMHFSHSDLPMETKDQIVREFISRPREMNPSIIRAMIQSFTTFATWFLNRSPNQKCMFELR